MMRILENNEKVRMVMTYDMTYSVDTKSDLIRVQKMMKKDNLMKKYMV